MTLEKLKELSRIAWMSAANAYRTYPNNKHTFVDYWHNLGKEECEQSINTRMVIALDKSSGNVVQDNDGYCITFKNETDGKNYLFTLQYKEKWVNENIEFIPINH